MDAEYSSKSDFSKAEIIKLQIIRCNEIRSKEMTKGYFNYTSEGKKIYVADSRKEWVSTVKALLKLLKPEVEKSKTFKEKLEKIEKQEKEIFEKYSYQPRMKVFENNEAKWKKINVPPYIPEVDASLPSNDPSAPKSIKTIKVKGLWNDYINLYWDLLVDLYDELFAQLNILIHDNNYFKQKVNYGFDIDEEDGEEDKDEEED